jgi:hypothetical protein
VLIRGAVGGKPVPALFRFFPSTKAVIDSFPSMEDIFDAFRAAAFTSFYSEPVYHTIAPSMNAMIERIKLRADTTLEKISDEEFDNGVAAMTEAAKVDDGPVIDSLDLIVLR